MSNKYRRRCKIDKDMPYLIYDVHFTCAQCGRHYTEHIRTKTVIPPQNASSLLPPDYRCARCRSRHPSPNFHNDPDYNISDESDMNPGEHLDE